MPAPQSDLPIVQLEPAPRPRRVRYGALFLVGAGGLVVLVALVIWFGPNLWVLREVWGSGLYDPAQPLAARVQAAYALAHDPRVPQRQLWNHCLNKSLPILARYVLAEGLTPETMASDPKDYCEKVAYSEGWPDWLRLLLIRPLAYGAEEGITFPEKPLRDLMQHTDPAIRLWAAYVRAATVHDANAEQLLKREADGPGPNQLLAAHLKSALDKRDSERIYWLDLATRWLRYHHPEAKKIWQGWEERGGRVVQTTS